MSEETRPRLSVMRFIDPQDDPSRRHLTVPATSPRTLPRALRTLTAQIPGAGRSRSLRDWVTETHTTALLVYDGGLGDGAVVHEWYADGVGPTSLLLGASMTKSALAYLVGVAMADDALGLDHPVIAHVPELRGSGYDGCTVEQLLTMTTGTAWVEDHRDPAGPASRLVACFGDRSSGGEESSRELLLAVRPQDPPGTRWEYSTADSQVLDWVRERATGTTYVEALGDLWRGLGCVCDAVVGVDVDQVALAGGGLAACAEDWLRLAALQLDGGGLLSPDWVRVSSTPPQPWLEPGRLPSSITTHAGFGYHWWPLDPDGMRVTADGSRGQLGYADRRLGVAVLKTSLWPYDDPWVDRAQRDLSYLGLPLVAAAVRNPD